MVESQSSKLITRVRFPSSAPFFIFALRFAIFFLMVYLFQFFVKITCFAYCFHIFIEFMLAIRVLLLW